MAGYDGTQRMQSPAGGVMAAKRALDVIAATAGLALLLPLFAVIALAIRLDDGGPVLFLQTRVGRSGRPFKIVKFRSMIFSAPGAGPNLTIAGDRRVTRVGAFLRRTKLDELPQLFNVQMSLVGPRPEPPDLNGKYIPYQRAVMLRVRPGMTDYASILLRDESALLARAADPLAFYQERLMPLKFVLTERYLHEISLLTDLRIILATLCALVMRRSPEFLIHGATLNRIVSASGIQLQQDAG